MNARCIRVSAIAAIVLIVGCGESRNPVTLQEANNPPVRLSDWGVVFADGKNLVLNERVTAYDLNTPLFSDYALKLRSVWVPEGTTINYRDDGPLDFPVGTIFSKTFHYEKARGSADSAIAVVKAERESVLDKDGRLSLDSHVLIETRLLVRYEDGWKALPYVWNATQDEAFLEVAGDVQRIELIDGEHSEQFVYVVPDTNQCSGCHTTDHSSKALQPIGPQAWQLNRDYTYGTATANQLRHWAGLGLLENLANDPPRGANWLHPGDATLEERAKAYLDINCAHCHNSVGAADTSGLDLTLTQAVDRDYGVCKPPVAVGRGSGDRPWDITPGRPDESIMIYRMQHSDPAIAMPELGRSTVHDEGIALLTEWVASLNGTC